jgi:hypothetical protein
MVIDNKPTDLVIANFDYDQQRRQQQYGLPPLGAIISVSRRPLLPAQRLAEYASSSTAYLTDRHMRGSTFDGKEAMEVDGLAVASTAPPQRIQSVFVAPTRTSVVTFGLQQWDTSPDTGHASRVFDSFVHSHKH